MKIKKFSFSLNTTQSPFIIMYNNQFVPHWTEDPDKIFIPKNIFPLFIQMCYKKIQYS